LKDSITGKLEFCEHCIIRKKIKVRFDTVMHYIEEILDYFHTDI